MYFKALAINNDRILIIILKSGDKIQPGLTLKCFIQREGLGEGDRGRETVHLWDTQDQWRPVVSLDQKGKNFTAIEWVRTASDNDCLKLWFHIYHQKIK